MALNLSQNRVFVVDHETFGNVTRPFLGIDGSKVIVADTGAAFGYAGQPALEEVVYATTSKNLLDQTFPLPLDFRVVGIQVMTALGVPAATQDAMFATFMTAFTPTQRAQYVAAFGAIDPNDATAVEAFVNQMLELLA